MLEDIARILRLIAEKPNERFEPRSDDLQGHFTSWFDGGAVNVVTGYTSYEFADGSKAMAHVLGYFYITITLADGTKISVIEETPRAGRELLLKGQQLLSREQEIKANTSERPNIDTDNSPTVELDFPFRLAQQFEFCTRCGHKVEPYPPGNVSHGYMEHSGIEPEGLENEPHYWCSHCQKRFLALSYRDTSIVCISCKMTMPFIVTFCGCCGAKFSRT